MLAFNSINIRSWSMMGANGVIGVAALELAELDKNIVVLTADQCLNSGLTRYKNSYPTRFFNIGIAEQNMVNVAAGLAKEGFNPVATAQAPFISMRSTDQVRISLGYMKLGVKLIGLSSGFSQGEYGATHHSINDLAIVRSIPNLTIYSPADCTETVKILLSLAGNPDPVYVRLTGITRNPVVYKSDYEFVSGKSIVLSEGSDITIFATGTLVYTCLEAAEELAAMGISAKVVNIHTIKPLDVEAIYEACDSKLIVTAEEHSIIGGLGGAVAEVLAQMKKHPPLKIIGAEDIYIKANDYDKLIINSQLSKEFVLQKIIGAYKKLD